jgi:hypothetical protein
VTQYAVLHDNALFSGLSPDTIDEIARELTPVELQPDEVLFREGGPR